MTAGRKAGRKVCWSDNVNPMRAYSTYLNRPAFVLPSPLRNVDTAELW